MTELGTVLSGGGDDHEGRGQVYLYWCPGCAENHQIIVGPGWWGFDGNQQTPTVDGSVLVRGVVQGEADGVCHSFIRAGRIEYLSDSTHSLAGQTVPMLTFGAQHRPRAEKNPASAE
jgi:hypothetical protein